MKTLKTIFEFYLNSSIHVALSVGALCLVTMLRYAIAVDVDLLIFVFFGTITGYNFVKYAGIAKLHHRSLARGLKAIQVFSLIAFLILLGEIFRMELITLLWTGLFGLLTLLYGIPVFSKRRSLRSIPGLKVLVIAVVWAGVTVILPMIGHHGFSTLEILLEFLQRFLIVLVLILPFEIRDLRYDLDQLGTIPQRIGVGNTKIVGLVLLVFILVLELVKGHSSTDSLTALVVMVLMIAGFLWRSEEEQPPYYSSFWVEGIPIIWLGSILILQSS